MELKISVIVPVYNVEKYIKQCLDSIVNQTLEDIEIICVDDGSTDDTLSILNEYKNKDNRITILTQDNLYAGVARNNGLKISKGKYLSFLDGDDFFELDMLEKMYNKAEEDCSDIVICSWNSYDNRNDSFVKEFEIDKKFVDISPFDPKVVSKELFQICKPNPWTKLFNREFFTKHALQFEDCICCNDITCVCLSLCLAKRISVLSDILVHYRICHSGNLTSDRTNHLDSVICAINRLEEKMKQFGVFDTFRETFLKKAVGSFKYGVKKCSKQQLYDRQLLAKKILVDDVYFEIYKKHKASVYTIPRRDKFF